jgi:PHD/YefM family antitoxin component YafN of YafNO toxin-antitoxin module
MIRATHIRSVTDFTRNAKAYIQQIRASGSPMALTVNGEAQVVVQDAESFQKMVDELHGARFILAMRESEADVRSGHTENLDEALAKIRGGLGL